MSSADPATTLRRSDAASLETSAIAGVVGFICDARLATLAALVVVATVREPQPALLLVLLAIPFSWLPLRWWSARPALFAQGAQFLVSDVVMTLVVVTAALASDAQPALTVAYVIESAALIGVMLPGRRAAAWALVSSGGSVAVVALAAGEPTLTTLVVVPAAVLTAHLAARLSRSLRTQGRLAQELVRLHGREAAVSERAALAREMHDSLAKTLHGVRMLSEALAVRLHADGSAHAPSADVIFEACDVATRETREVLGGLRALSTPCLADGVRLEVRIWQDRTGIPVDLRVHGDEQSWLQDAETGWRVLRVLGELLENVHRHAAASQVVVTLLMDDDAAALTVRDDGRGIVARLDPDELALGGHYGLIGVRERAAEAGGSVSIGTPVGGHGTEATLHLPRLVRVEQH